MGEAGELLKIVLVRRQRVARKALLHPAEAQKGPYSLSQNRLGVYRIGFIFRAGHPLDWAVFGLTTTRLYTANDTIT